MQNTFYQNAKHILCKFNIPTLKREKIVLKITKYECLKVKINTQSSHIIRCFGICFLWFFFRNARVLAYLKD
jgi:hypothetical protein